MSTNTSNALERPVGLDKFTQNVFQLCGSKRSSWLKEGTGGESGIPAQYMHTSNILFLDIKSKLYLGKDKGYMPTQYVIGASTHYVNDYWLGQDGNPVFDKLTKEQGQAKGYEFQVGLLSIYTQKGLVEEEGRSKRLGICFEKGILDLRKYADEPVLRKFIWEHDQNKMAPNAAENKDPKRLKLFMFEPVIKESKAAKSKVIEQWDDNVRAILFVDKLRTKTSGGFAYNESALDAVLSIIQEGVGLAIGEVNQKFEIAAKSARVDGVMFMKMIDEAMSDYRLEIGKATDLNVVEYGANEVKMVVDGKKRILLAFKKETKKDDMLDELVLHLLGSPLGKSDYKELKRASETAKIKALSAGK